MPNTILKERDSASSMTNTTSPSSGRTWSCTTQIPLRDPDPFYHHASAESSSPGLTGPCSSPACGRHPHRLGSVAATERTAQQPVSPHTVQVILTPAVEQRRGLRYRYCLLAVSRRYCSTSSRTHLDAN